MPLAVNRVQRTSGSTASQGIGKVEPHMCVCGLDHPGRPDGIPGCGAHWNITLEDS
ncbi:hypothetical protein ATK86_0914 [Nocardia fluminea]|uniref:Uncharacterized protein n=1 Tax=Nocardia fluminea TaxID=134984 RepID=A0A2N3WYE8_9NOCA|nr:hypothetical protein ATK86_0914 [Nocardia fluminea]